MTDTFPGDTMTDTRFFNEKMFDESQEIVVGDGLYNLDNLSYLGIVVEIKRNNEVVNYVYELLPVFSELDIGRDNTSGNEYHNVGNGYAYKEALDSRNIKDFHWQYLENKHREIMLKRILKYGHVTG